MGASGDEGEPTCGIAPRDLLILQIRRRGRESRREIATREPDAALTGSGVIFGDNHRPVSIPDNEAPPTGEWQPAQRLAAKS